MDFISLWSSGYKTDMAVGPNMSPNIYIGKIVPGIVWELIIMLENAWNQIH